jgi:hypothetical protein
MTYQEIVNRIQGIVNAHYQLADFGYGDLSDLKTKFENSSGDSAVQADYPYLFLNPGIHNRTLSTITYNFNMIVMDMARGEVSDQPYNNSLAIQSQCQQMIDDVLANLYYGFKDKPEVVRTNISYTPFNERFSDDVSGMTASLSIEVPQGLNDCVAPIEDFELLATLPIKTGLARSYNISNFTDQWDIPTELDTYKIEWDFTIFNVVEILPNGPAPYDVPYFTILQDQDNLNVGPRILIKDEYGSATGQQRIKGSAIVSLSNVEGGNNLFFSAGFAPALVYPGTDVFPIEIPSAWDNSVGGPGIKIYKRV